jgi:hypothetical protein
LVRHGTRVFTSSKPVNERGQLSGVLLKLALELADEERSLLLVALLKYLADAEEHRP